MISINDKKLFVLTFIEINKTTVHQSVSSLTCCKLVDGVTLHINPDKEDKPAARIRSRSDYLD